MDESRVAPPRAVVFHAEGVTNIYRMGEVQVHALRGIDLELYNGELVVLLGPSGSGKSTLLNILGGLDVPSTGGVRYKDQDLSSFSDTVLTRYRRHHVGWRRGFRSYPRFSQHPCSLPL